MNGNNELFIWTFLSDAYCSIPIFIKRRRFLAKFALNLINEELKKQETEKLLFYHARVKFNLEKYEEALEILDKLIKINSKISEYYYERELSKSWLEDWQGELEDQNNAIELNNMEAKYYYRRGIDSIFLDNYKNAFLDFTYVIQLAKTYTDAYILKTKILFENNQKEALELLLTALKNCENDKDKIFTALSFVYFSQNDYKKALKYANEAIMFNKENGTGYYRKNCALVALGKQNEAREFLEKANALGYEETF